GHFAKIESDISRLDQKVERDISRLDQKIEREISRLDQKVEMQVSELRSHVDQRFTNVEGSLRLHNWMLGTILGFIVAVFFKVFSHRHVLSRKARLPRRKLLYTPQMQPTRARFTLLRFAFALSAVTYLDRVCIATAATSIREGLHLNAVQM